MSFVTLTGTFADNTTMELNDCVEFRFEKDRYSATQSFTGKFLVDFFSKQFKSVSVDILGHRVLGGYVEKQYAKRDASKFIVTIKAKSYSSMLDCNHVQPGTYTNMSFYGAYVAFASHLNGISCGPGSNVLPDVTFTDWNTLFDVMKYTSIRAYGVYPFVTMSNQIRSSLPTNPATFNLSASKILDVHENWDTSALISTVYMKDEDGNYAVYSKDCPYTQSLGITRVKHIAFMKAWATDINGGLNYKLYSARNRCHTYSLTYSGYRGEDIYDNISFPNGYLREMTSFEVNAVEIVGNDKTISTTVKHYDDYYCSQMRS